MKHGKGYLERLLYPGGPHGVLLAFSLPPPLLLFRAKPKACGGSQARDPVKLQLLAYTTATAMQDLSRVCNLHHSSQQCQILNPLSKAKG